MFRCCPSRRPRVCQFDLNVLDGPISLTSDLVWSSGSWQLAVGSWQLAVGSWQLAVGSFPTLDLPAICF
jgi:hypothetical protein